MRVHRDAQRSVLGGEAAFARFRAQRTRYPYISYRKILYSIKVLYRVNAAL